RRALRAAAVALPRHLLRDAHARAVHGALRHPGEDHRPRRLRRVQPVATDLLRHRGGGGPGELRDVPARGGRYRPARPGRPGLLRLDPRPRRPGGARERASRRVPRRLGAPAARHRLHHRGLPRRGGRRAHRPRARPCRAQLQLLDDVRRVRLPRHPRRPPQRGGGVRGGAPARARPLLLRALLPEHLAARAGPVPAGRDPLPAHGHRLALVAPARGAAGFYGADRMTAPILEARSLSKSFGAVVAATDVSIDVPQGQRVSLIGSNGAGKTTFVNMVTGYLKPDAGQILLDGRDITRLSPRQVTRLGVARSFQIPQLAAELSVLDNMLVAAACNAGAPSFLRPARTPEAIDAALAILERFDLAGHAGRPVRELPGGVRKLLDIAMALVGKPRLLLLDEPTSGVSV